MKRVYLLLATSLLMAGEPSVFEAGNLDSANPYGLTSTEKHILQNKKSIEQLRSRLYTIETKVNSLEERVTGLGSVVEGLDENLRQLKLQLKNQKSVDPQELEILKNDLNKSVEIQKSNFDQIKTVLKELSSLIDHINTTYVTKEELNQRLDKLYKLIKSEKLSKKSGAQLYKEARKAYRQKRYDKAIELFKAAINKHYKPATSNFYIGESCYYTKNYSCAIQHYKKSASLYQNASYMPTLLLHTAISLERLGKRKEAKTFYRNLINLYPNSKAAKYAKKRVK